MLIDQDFAPHLAHLDLDGIDSSDDPVYAVDDCLVIRAINPAYVEFGLRNGLPEVQEQCGPGCDLLAAIDQPERERYAGKLVRVLMGGDPWHHTYECSSPDEFRQFRQSVYPLPGGGGLLISNHLIAAGPHPGPATEATADHVSPDGVISQCCQCRKVRNWSRPGGWDWVPSLVANMDPRASHTFCDLCRDHYYPDTD